MKTATKNSIIKKKKAENHRISEKTGELRKTGVTQTTGDTISTLHSLAKKMRDVHEQK